jgi:hypothetical protein
MIAVMEATVVKAFQQSSALASFGGFRCNSVSFRRSQLQYFQQWEGKDEGGTTQKKEKVEVGSKEYIQGFLSSPIQDETLPERGSGLGQALKLGGGVSVALILLVIGFLASNGLI